MPSQITRIQSLNSDSHTLSQLTDLLRLAFIFSRLSVAATADHIHRELLGLTYVTLRRSEAFFRAPWLSCST